MLSTVPQREMVLPSFTMSTTYGLKHKDEFLQRASFY